MKVFLFLLVILYPAIAVAEGSNYISYLCTNNVEQGGSGFKIMRDGKLLKLMKLGNVQIPVEIPVGEDSASTARLFNLAETNGFLDSGYDRGKCSIMYHSPSREHVVRYANKAPKPIKELFEELQALHRSVVELKPNSKKSAKKTSDAK